MTTAAPLRTPVLVSGLLVVLAILVSCWVGMQVFQQVTKCPEVKERFGFDYGTPYVGEASCAREVLQVTSVRAGGAFELAGVSSGDLLSGQLTDLCVTLDGMEPGATVTLAVRSPGGSGCVTDWPVREAVIVAP